ncbi:serine/threonine-protein phosphatase [Streptomyces sp. PSKA28]|uniref:Serine/threonine-protein phosphatase n=1 Tax=Streptomyces himalayensis subsp. himalayensis TaxID=2756131 RepID=A0A7W0DRT1_9ACTN|nr:serine/threonine-protein phosphatase [Streptomyces himalayensis subsp. himalayensis]
MRQADHQRDRRPAWLFTKRPAGCGRRTGGGSGALVAAGAPALIVFAVVILCFVGGARLWLPLLPVGPALAAAVSRPRAVVCVGFLASALGALLGTLDGMSAGDLAVVLATVVAVTLASGLASALRGRRERVLAAVRSVAEAAQHALLRPVPAAVGPFQVAVRYSAAAAEARIGGDLYALVPTPYGVRLIVGDVRGKGLPAVSTAALVLGVFREAAYDEPDLLDVVARIERSLARNLAADDFVTAVVAGYPKDGRMELVNCGHAPPLLVRDCEVTAVEPSRPAPPLGLGALGGETPALHILPFDDGDQLLLYTDGVTEARDHRREFYPLGERLARHVTHDPSHTVAALHDELLTHVGGRLHDDAALIMLRKPVGSAAAWVVDSAAGEGTSGEVMSREGTVGSGEGTSGEGTVGSGEGTVGSGAGVAWSREGARGRAFGYGVGAPEFGAGAAAGFGVNAAGFGAGPAGFGVGAAEGDGGGQRRPRLPRTPCL